MVSTGTASSSLSIESLLDLDPVAVAEAPACLRHLREEGPVVWVERLKAFAVTRYAEADEVLGDPERFSSALGDPRGPTLQARLNEVRAELAAGSEEFHALMERLHPDWRGVKVLISTDGAQHQVHRKLVNKMFTPRRAALLEPRITEIAESVVADIAGQEVVELVAPFCVRLPLTVIAEQLGIDQSRLADFRRWSADANSTIGNDTFERSDVMRITRSIVEFSEYFRPLMEERRKDPKDDFVTVVVQAEDEEYPFTDEIRLSLISQMIGAGHETTMKTLAFGAAYLAKHPEVAEQLRADESLVPSFVEEVLRLASPTQGLYRYVREDTELGGVPLPAGAAVLVLFASANRTDAQFPDPDELDLSRPNHRSHLAFGAGKHFCPGSPLARIVATVGFRVLLRSMPAWHIADDRGGEVFDASYLLRGHRELWLRFDQPAAS